MAGSFLFSSDNHHSIATHSIRIHIILHSDQYESVHVTVHDMSPITTCEETTHHQALNVYYKSLSSQLTGLQTCYTKNLINRKSMKFLTLEIYKQAHMRRALLWVSHHCQQTTCSVTTVRTWQCHPLVVAWSNVTKSTCCLCSTVLYTSLAQQKGNMQPALEPQWNIYHTA